MLQILSGNSSTGSLGVEQAVGEECGSLHLSLSAGETHECSVVLHNVSSQPVEELTITLESKMDKDMLHQVHGSSVVKVTITTTFCKVLHNMDLWYDVYIDVMHNTVLGTYNCGGFINNGSEL